MWLPILGLPVVITEFAGRMARAMYLNAAQTIGLMTAFIVMITVVWCSLPDGCGELRTGKVAEVRHERNPAIKDKT